MCPEGCVLFRHEGSMFYVINQRGGGVPLQKRCGSGWYMDIMLGRVAKAVPFGVRVGTDVLILALGTLALSYLGVQQKQERGDNEEKARGVLLTFYLLFPSS